MERETAYSQLKPTQNAKRDSVSADENVKKAKEARESFCGANLPSIITERIAAESAKRAAGLARNKTMRDETEISGVTVYLGLGSSLGYRAVNLRQALARLDAPDFQINAVSSFYESPHLGLQPEDAERYPAHLNCALKAETILSPLEILQRIRDAENAGGRQRIEHWGPRTIDIDLLLYADSTLNSDDLTLPHPGILERAFVLRPLAEIAPDLRLPNGAAILERLNAPEIAGQPLEIYGKTRDEFSL